MSVLLAWNGYLLTVACPCGVVFGRWVTPVDTDADLTGIARLNYPRLAISVEEAFQPAHLPRRAHSPSLSSIAGRS